MRTRTFAVGAVFTLALASLAAERPALAGSPSQNTALYDYDPCTVPIHV